MKKQIYPNLIALKNKILDELPGIAGGLIFLSLILCVGYCVSHHRDATGRRYGFCTMTPDLKWVPCHLEPLMIRCIKPGGAFDKAGFMDRDILVLPQIHSVPGFHKLLDKPKGTEIEFDVIPYERFNPVCDPDKWGKPERRVVVAP